MRIIMIISLLSVITLGCLTSYSDIICHKAYNKHIVVFALIGLAIQTLSFCFWALPIGYVMVNIIITFGLSLLFFAGRVWAAGDAKLFTTMILLLPYSIYHAKKYEIFPAFMALGFVFMFALIYVIIESFFFMGEEIKKYGFNKTLFPLPKLTKQTIIAWLLGYIGADTMDSVLFYMDMEKNFIQINAYLLILVNILFITAILSLVEKYKWRILAICFFLAMRVVLSIVTGVIFTPMSPWLLLIVYFILMVRCFTNRYNYRIIPTSTIREGQILAKSSLVFMLPSTVKDLPKWTDESTRCRLNGTQVAAIKRWENSKYGQPELTIVRHIPFAPFIFGGILAFIGIKLYLGAG